MQVGMMGLGRMGANMARRLMRAGHECVAYDVSSDAVRALAHEGAVGASSLGEFAARLRTPRVVWMMVPAAVVDATLDGVIAHLAAGDIVVDGGNSYYRDDIERAKRLGTRGLHYVDCGTSGGVWGLERGYCLMIGGEADVVCRLDPLFATLAPGVGTIPRTPGRAQILEELIHPAAMLQRHFQGRIWIAFTGHQEAVRKHLELDCEVDRWCGQSGGSWTKLASDRHEVRKSSSILLAASLRELVAAAPHSHPHPRVRSAPSPVDGDVPLDAEREQVLEEAFAEEALVAAERRRRVAEPTPGPPEQRLAALGLRGRGAEDFDPDLEQDAVAVLHQRIDRVAGDRSAAARPLRGKAAARIRGRAARLPGSCGPSSSCPRSGARSRFLYSSRIHRQLDR